MYLAHGTIKLLLLRCSLAHWKGAKCVLISYRQGFHKIHMAHHWECGIIAVLLTNHFLLAWMHHAVFLPVVQTCGLWACWKLQEAEREESSNLTIIIYMYWKKANSAQMQCTQHAWNWMQWTHLCPLYIICWLTTGRAIVSLSTSTKPKHCFNRAPSENIVLKHQLLEWSYMRLVTW